MYRSYFLNTIKLFSSLFFIVALFSLTNSKAHAQDANVLCEPDKNLFEKVIAAYPTLDIRRTTVNMSSSLLLDLPTQLVFNRSIRGIQQCYVWLLEEHQICDPQVATYLAELPAECNTTATDCSDIYRTYDVSIAGTDDSRFSSTITSGSLLGVANMLQGAVINEPVPVNMAFWWNDNVNRIPLAGKALAQEVTYSGPLVTIIFDIWKTFRNLAYALLAVIMLVIGFMIITRRKINPQVSVTAQTALPRVILAVILITFSYPIGAAAASAAWVLGMSAMRIFYSAAFRMPACSVDTFQEFAIGPILFALVGMAMVFGGMGIVWAIASILAVAGILIAFIIAMLKVFTTYLRIVMSIIFAPLIMAVGAIPGNENTTEKWFRELAANVIIIPAIFGIIAITGAILVTLWLSGPLEGAWGSTVLAVLGAPFIGLYGFSLAAKAPKIIRGWLVPETTKRK